MPASPETAATLAARRATRRRRFAWFFGVLAIVALGAALYWFIVGRFSEETDDAYVAGNVVQIAAQIQGTVTDVLVADTQQVKAGQALVRLDDAEAAAAFAQAQAQLAQAVRQVANTRLSMQTYEQTVKAREADLKLAQQAYRARAGASVEVVAPEELARAKSSLANAQAALAGAQAQREAARALGSERPVGQNPAVQQAAAQFKLAYRNLKRTTIVSPVDGTVGQRSVQIGQQVGPGVPLMSVVQLRQVWVEANFKEGQLRHMRVGQPVRLESDLYGARVTYHGELDQGGAAPAGGDLAGAVGAGGAPVAGGAVDARDGADEGARRASAGRRRAAAGAAHAGARNARGRGGGGGRGGDPRERRWAVTGRGDRGGAVGLGRAQASIESGGALDRSA